MDAQHAWDGEISAAVFGTGEDFRLVFPDGPIDAAVIAEATARGLVFAGVITVTGGRCYVKCEPTNPDALSAMAYAAPAFAEHLIAKIGRKNASTLRLDRYPLPDTQN